MIALDRTAGQQIDLATEYVFDLLVKPKEIPEVYFGSKGDEVNIAAAALFASR
ncbi:MAG: hypothetical protein M3Z85_09705 [Acidobacteriota bacterium]|nr:hypothetical protein [Acidobacteriota bacterium]